MNTCGLARFIHLALESSCGQKSRRWFGLKKENNEGNDMQTNIAIVESVNR